MVWAKTDTVGCGATSWREGGFTKSFIVCNYGPSGNFRRARMYQVGQTCSRCPSGTACSSDGLCSGGGSSTPAARPPRPVQLPIPTQQSQQQQQPVFINSSPSLPSNLRPTRPLPILPSPNPPIFFGFVPMTDDRPQDSVPRPVAIQQNPTNFASPPLLQPVDNDISVQNLLQPIPQAASPPPSFFQRPIIIQRPPSSQPQQQQQQQQQERPLRRPNCTGMFAFMCNLFG